jgi:hypothetical protein
MNFNPFNRPFYDGRTIRRRHRGEGRGYSPALLATQLVGALLTLVVPAAVMALYSRKPEDKKPFKHA